MVEEEDKLNRVSERKKHLEVFRKVKLKKDLEIFRKPFRENEKTFGDFMIVRKSFSTTHPGVSQNSTPHLGDITFVSFVS